MAILRSIGNSQGVLIPKSLIEQAGLADCELVFSLEERGLLIEPVRRVRAGWREEIDSATSAKEYDIDREWLEADLGVDFDEEQ